MSTISGDELERNLVGMEERFKKIESLLCLDSPDVRTIGIWGMAGIGKTTLVEVVQKRFSHKFNSCFHVDVSNEVKRCGLRGLKNEFLSTLLKDNNVDMSSSFTYIRLGRTKVFVVLDNVSDVEQLDCLIGDLKQRKSRFCVGSRIFVTSRDQKLLTDNADVVYEVEALDLEEADKLFRQNAFRRDSSKMADYKKLSTRVVEYCGGNPLALKVLGSYLHSRSVKEWDSALKELEKVTNDKVQNVLKTSYDALDRRKQFVFLDIACFLKLENREFVEKILEDDSHIAISVLVERSLITIVEGGICMHDLIQEMAWDIVREESKDHGQYSRLWIAQEAYSVLHKDKGSARVQGIFLDVSNISTDLCLSSTVFRPMENLRLLKIYNSDPSVEKVISFKQRLQYLPDSIRYLCWAYYPLRSLPSDFEPQNLVTLDMSNSKLEKLWDGKKKLENLKQINLDGSSKLVELPDLSEAPKLEHMDLSWCKSLRIFPKVSGNLKYLDVQLSGIENFHSSFESLENLEHVNLSGCKSFVKLPKLPRNVRILYLKGSKYFMNLFDEVNLSALSEAWMQALHCFLFMLPLLHLDSLTHLDLSCCGISYIPDSLDRLSSIESLNLSMNYFTIIPSTIKQMYKLKDLHVGCCRNLEYLLDLPSSVESINAGQCVSLKRISVSGLISLRILEASGCRSLEEFSNDERGCASWEKLLTASREAITLDTNKDRLSNLSFVNGSELNQSSKDHILTLFQREVFGVETAFHLDFNTARFVWQKASACYVGNEIPEWFTHQSEESSIHVSLGDNCYSKKFIGFAASVVLEFKNVTSKEQLHCLVSSELRFKTRSGAIHECHVMDCPLPENAMSSYVMVEASRPHVLMWHCYSGFPFDVEKELREEAIEALFEFKLKNPPDEGKLKIIKCGIHMITLEEAHEFGFGVDNQKLSLRKWIKPAQRLKLLSSQQKRSSRELQKHGLESLRRSLQNHRTRSEQGSLIDTICFQVLMSETDTYHGFLSEQLP